MQTIVNPSDFGRTDLRKTEKGGEGGEAGRGATIPNLASTWPTQTYKLLFEMFIAPPAHWLPSLRDGDLTLIADWGGGGGGVVLIAGRR